MTTITAVLGDITHQQVDAIVNAANRALRGGGGVDGAIHRAGGPAILRDCIARFPHGLDTGDAGWTTAGDLPARWVIHTVGPNRAAGQRDRSLLEACYRRALAVADELGARTVAFPLVGAGAFGWPRHEAIAAAVEAIAATTTRVEEARIVVQDQGALEEVRAMLAQGTPLRILHGVQVLHERGYHRVRVLPGVSPSGMHWRVTVTLAAPRTTAGGSIAEGSTYEGDVPPTLRYTTGALTEFAGGTVSPTTSPDAVADLILQALPDLQPTQDDPDYVSWYSGLLQLADRVGLPPVAYADYFDDTAGWEVGWGSGVRYPHPPAPPR